MKCRDCGSDTRVIQTCYKDNVVLRNRWCIGCKRHYFTEEKISEHQFDVRYEINQHRKEKQE